MKRICEDINARVCVCVCVCVNVRVCVYIQTYINMIYLLLKELKKKTTCPALSPKPSNPTLDPEPKTLDPYIDMHPCTCAHYIYVYLCPQP